MKKSVISVFFNSIMIIVFFAGCLIEDVEQPAEIEAGFHAFLNHYELWPAPLVGLLLVSWKTAVLITTVY